MQIGAGSLIRWKKDTRLYLRRKRNQTSGIPRAGTGFQRVHALQREPSKQ